MGFSDLRPMLPIAGVKAEARAVRSPGLETCLCVSAFRNIWSGLRKWSAPCEQEGNKPS